MTRFYLHMILLTKFLCCTVPTGSMSAGSDLYYEPFRWDQKFIPFILSFEGNSHENIQELQALAEATGGEIVVSDSFQSTLGKQRFVLHVSRVDTFHIFCNCNVI